MSKNASLLRRFVVFLCGTPGYVLTFVPWMFVLAWVFMIIAQYTSTNDQPLELIQIQYESLDVVQAQAFLVLLFSVGFWIFMAWFVKHGLLWISAKFGHTERIWQTVKVTALVSGWLAVFLCGVFVFDSLSAGFVISELLVTAIGLVSIGLEYILSRLLLNKS